jgi:hypothetical protein
MRPPAAATAAAEAEMDGCCMAAGLEGSEGSGEVVGRRSDEMSGDRDERVGIGSAR